MQLFMICIVSQAMVSCIGSTSAPSFMGRTKIRNIFDEDSSAGESFNECFNPNNALEDDEGNFTDKGRLRILYDFRQH